MQNANKIISYIGFSIKSNQVVFGIDNIEVYKKKIHLIVVSNTISDKSRVKILEIASRRDIEVLELDCSLEDITKRKNCKVLALTNFDLSNAIKKSK